MNRTSIAVSSPEMGMRTVDAPARHHGFALAVLGRYKHWFASAGPAERVFKKKAAPEQNIYALQQMEFAPQMRLQLVFAGPDSVGPAPEQVVGPLAAPLILRTQRQETVWQTAPPSELASSAELSAPSRGKIAPPVARVFQQPAARQATPPAQEIVARDSEVFAKKHRVEWPARRNEPVALPAQEVDRVTEQVLRTIDRRVAAQRERRGRR